MSKADRRKCLEKTLSVEVRRRRNELRPVCASICSISLAITPAAFLLLPLNPAAVRLQPGLNWANVCSPNISDTSTNYDSFLN